MTELCLVCKNDSPIYFDMDVQDLLGNSLINGFMITLHDITLRKRIENKLLEANHELDHFVYRISHDLCALLLSSLGLIDLAYRDAATDGMEYMRMIEMNLKKLDGFIEDIKSFYCNEKMILRTRPVGF